MYRLGTDSAISHVINRVQAADRVDEVVVATSKAEHDDVVGMEASYAGAGIYRGSELDVLERFYSAAEEDETDVVIRVTADCPLVSPETIDALVDTLRRCDLDYVVVDKESFPKGLGAEVFTCESLHRVWKTATDSHHREHVTPYYREHKEEFDTGTVEYAEVFPNGFVPEHKIRLTLDEADDYRLLKRIYDQVAFDDLLDVITALRYVEEHNLYQINRHVRQKGVHD